MKGAIRIFTPDGEFGSATDAINDIAFSVAAGCVGFSSPGTSIAVEFLYQDIPDIIAALMKVHADPHLRRMFGDAERHFEGRT